MKASKFQNCLTVVLGDKSQNTKRTYAQALKSWAKFRGSSTDHKLFASVKPLDCRSYLVSLKETLSPNSCNLFCSALKSIFQALEDFELIPINPWRAAVRGLSRSREQVRPTKLIPYHLVPKILSLPDISTLEGLHDRAILTLAFGCGLRRCEIQRIKLSDFKVVDGINVVHLPKTKAKKSQDQPIPQWAWISLEQYISNLTSRLAAPKDSYLFPSNYGINRHKRPISPEKIFRIYKKYLAICGIDAAPHSARATAVSQLLTSGVSERDAANFLRHSGTTMVQTYDKRSRSISDHCGITLSYPTAIPESLT